jgi:hypothetical protein
MGLGLTSPAEDTYVWDIRGEKILEPIHIILCYPILFAFSVEAMDRDDATIL